MALTIDTEIRERVATYFVAQLEQATPDRREKIIRLLINRLPRSVIDGLWIAQALTNDSIHDAIESEA
jgi:hypothetical protein